MCWRKNSAMMLEAFFLDVGYAAILEIILFGDGVIPIE